MRTAQSTLYNAKSAKQGRKRFNFNVKTKYIANLRIVYLWPDVFPSFFNGEMFIFPEVGHDGNSNFFS